MLAAIPAWVGLAATAVGTGAAVYGQIQQGKMAEETGRYNQQLANKQAGAIERAAADNSRKLAIENRRLLADQRATYAGSGVQVDTGTPLEVAAQSASILRLNLLNEETQARNQADYVRSQGTADAAYGAASARGSYLGAAGSLFSGIGSLGGKARALSDAGAFKTKKPFSLSGSNTSNTLPGSYGSGLFAGLA